MTVLVAQNRIQIPTARCRLVNAEMLAKVILNLNPVAGVFLLIPVTEVTELVAVSFAKRRGIDAVYFPYTLEGYGVVVKVYLLKKPRTRGTSECRRRQATRRNPSPRYGHPDQSNGAV